MMFKATFNNISVKRLAIITFLYINAREYRSDNQNGHSREHDNIDEEKQNKNTTQYVLDTTIRKQTHMT